MVDVTNRADVAVRLRAGELLFGHDTFILEGGLAGRKARSN
jgi:hypothetical protein